MTSLRCQVIRGLPKEVEEEVNKFLESMACEIHHVLQSESTNHVTITIFYVVDPQEDLPTG